MEPNEKVEEQNNMDSAPGGAPPQKTPESLHKSAPEGEYNPFKRNLIPHQERHKYVKEGLINKGNLLEEADLLADFDKSVGLLPPGHEREEMIADHALDEINQKSQKMISKRDEDLMKQWIQQNPVGAASLGLTEEDPYGLYAETRFMANTAGIPEEDAIALEKEKMESPIAKRSKSPLTQIGYDTYLKMFSNPLANIGARAGNIIAAKIGEWEQRRAQEIAEDQAQYEREAKDFDDQFGGYIQEASSSPHVDEATKELMAQQWKQQFAQINADKNAIPPRITPEDYAMQKNQLLGNAKTYTDAVRNIESAAQNWVKAYANGEVSEGTPRNQRDMLQTLATGKGMNISETQDGKSVTNKGLSIQNVNGTPTLVGYTEGQLAKIRQEYDQLSQQGQVNPQETSFEAFVANMRPKPGTPGYDEKPDYWKGVNIPASQLATGEGMPKFVPKDPSFTENIDQMADDLAAKAITGPESISGMKMSLQDKWNVVQDRAGDYATKMLQNANMDTMRSLAGDYLGINYEMFEDLVNTNKHGQDGIRAYLADKVKNAIQEKFMTNPTLLKQNADFVNFTQQQAMQNARNIVKGSSGGGGRMPQWQANQQETVALYNEYLNNPNNIQNIGTDYVDDKGKGGFWGFGSKEANRRIKLPNGTELNLTDVEPGSRDEKIRIAQALGILNLVKDQIDTGGQGGMDDINFSNPNG